MGRDPNVGRQGFMNGSPYVLVVERSAVFLVNFISISRYVKT